MYMNLRRLCAFMPSEIIFISQNKLLSYHHLQTPHFPFLKRAGLEGIELQKARHGKSSKLTA